MEIVSAREFRTNQTKYFGLANKGEDVILKSRGQGSFRLIPITSKDAVADKSNITERLRMALHEVKLMREGKIKELSIEELIDDDDFLTEEELLSIQKGLDDIKNGRVARKMKGESLDDFLERTGNV